MLIGSYQYLATTGRNFRVGAVHGSTRTNDGNRYRQTTTRTDEEAREGVTSDRRAGEHRK